jgi:hypothetical protein
MTGADRLALSAAIDAPDAPVIEIASPTRRDEARSAMAVATAVTPPSVTASGSPTTGQTTPAPSASPAPMPPAGSSVHSSRYTTSLATSPRYASSVGTTVQIPPALVRVPRRVLLPIILVFCLLGAYAINSSYFDVGVMAAMGVLGFVLERRRVPLGPVVLGIILGGPLEERFIQTLTGSDGSPAAFFSRPMAALLGLITIALWLTPAILAWRRRSGKQKSWGP